MKNNKIFLEHFFLILFKAVKGLIFLLALAVLIATGIIISIFV